MKEKINMFIAPIFNKKNKHHLSSYIQLRILIRKLNKTSPSFDMMMEIYEFIKLLEDIYMYGNGDNHYLSSASVPKTYDGAMIYKENNFEIKYILRVSDKFINIECNRNSKNTKSKRYISFHEGDDNIINNKYDEEFFLFITSCIMSGLIDLIKYYYKNKKL